MNVRRIVVWIASLVAIAALVWIGRSVNWRAALTMVGTLDWLQLAIVFTFPATYYAVAAWRLGTILRSLGAPVQFRTLLGLTLASFAASYALPSFDLVGKSVKFAILGTKERLGPEKIIPALSVEAISGTGTDLILRVLLFFMLGLPAFLQETIFKIALAATLTFAIFFFLPLALPTFARTILRNAHTFEAYVRMRAEFLRLFSTPRQLVAPVALSMAAFALALLEIKVVTAMLGIPLDAKALFLVYSAFQTALMIPTPGGIGTIEGALAGIFWTLGGNPLWGLAIAITFRIKEFAWVIVGFVVLAKNGIRIFNTNSAR